MNWSRSFRIGGREVGDGRPCFVIAEAGSNHNGSFDQAARLIDIAADAGADAVKFQVFRASRLYPRSAGVSGYLQNPRAIYDIIAEMEMPYEWLPALAAHCGRRGVEFMATAFDEQSLAQIAPYVNAFKVASYEMTHEPLVRDIARQGKPVLMSTGTADAGEVAAALDVIEQAGNHELVVLQCTAAYPAPPTALHLRAMAGMRERFGVLTGLSDHSRHPIVAPVAAVALGAVAIEKHFTVSNALPGPDHRFAVEPEELAALVQAVRETEAALGRSEKASDPVEDELRAFARRAVFAVRDIAEGEAFTPDNVAVLRRGQQPDGLAPRDYPGLLGRRAARPIGRDRPLQPADVA